MAEELKIARTRLKQHDKRFTQPHVSHLTGIPLSTLKQIELGNSPIDMDQLFALAKALDESAAAIIARAETHLPTADVIRLRDAEPTADDIVEPRAARRGRSKPQSPPSEAEASQEPGPELGA